MKSLAEVDVLIDFILDILGVKCLDEDLNEHKRKFKFLYKFIISTFGFLTIPEIKEAFRMYVAKEFGHKDIYRTLDTIVISDVLNCFIDVRAEKLRAYNQKNKALEFYRDEAKAIAENMAIVNMDAMMASIKVLELDGGKRATDAML